MMFWKSISMFAAVLAAAVLLGGCSGSPSIGFTASTTATSVSGSYEVDQGQTATVTVTINNDSNNKGFTLTAKDGTLACPSGASTCAQTSAQTITVTGSTVSAAVYTAPASAETDTITATSTADTSKTHTITVVVPAALGVSTSSLQPWAVGTASTQTVSVTGGVAPYTWTIDSSTAPSGCFSFSSSSSGALTANTTGATSSAQAAAACIGSWSLTFKVTDSNASGAQSYTTGAIAAAINGPSISFAYPSTSSWNAAGKNAVTVGGAYSGSVLAADTASGASLTYSLVSGSTLPASGNLALNTTSDAISGTPHAGDVGGYSFAVKVVDQYGDVATSPTYSLTVNAAPAIAFGTAPASTATDGVLYSSTVSASGGAGALQYTLVTSSNLPSDFAVNKTTGAVSGTPANLTSFSFTVQAADSYDDTPVQQQYTVTVSPGAAKTLAISGLSPNPVTAGNPVSFTVTAKDVNGYTATGYTGTVKITSNDAQATLPSNAALTAGVGDFAVTMKTAGSSQTVTATDIATASITGTSGSIQVNPASATHLGFASTTPTTATNGAAFSVTVNALDSFGNIDSSNGDTVSITSSTDSAATLPANAALSGGTHAFQVTLKTDGAQTIAANDVTNGSITAASASITVSSVLAITTASPMPSWNKSIAGYPAKLAAAGGSGSGYTFSETTSVLSSYGLVLASDGSFTGTPTQTGDATFTAQVKDSSNATATKSLTIHIYPALTLSSNSLASGYVGVAYSQTVTGGGGGGSLAVSTSSALSPSGNGSLALSSGGSTSAPTMTVSGTPNTTATPESFGVKLTDSTTTASITQGYTFTISTPTAPTLPAANPSSLPSATVNANYSGSITATDSVGSSFTWTINGSTTLNNGEATTVTLNTDTLTLTANGSTLNVTGKPGAVTTSGSPISFTALIKDNTDNLSSGTVTYTIAVNNSLTVTVDQSGVPQGMIGMPYSFSNITSVSGGSGNYQVTGYAGAPSGLALSTTDNWSLVGTPTNTSCTPTYSTPCTSTVTVTVEDTTNTGVTGQATFDVTVVAQIATSSNHTSYLNGQYICHLDRYWPKGVTANSSTLYRGGMLFAFTANGSAITGGEADWNSPEDGYQSVLSGVTGTYMFGADNRGWINILHNGSTELVLAAVGSEVSSSVFNALSIVEMDDAGSSPSDITGSGRCYKQTASSLSSYWSSSKSFAYIMRGESSSGVNQNQIGYVRFNGSGSVTGEADFIKSGVYEAASGTPSTYFSYTPGSTDSYGRAVLTSVNADVDDAVVYATNNTLGQVFVLTTDSHNSGNSMWIGEARLQNSTNISATYPLSGNAVLRVSGLDSTLSGYKAAVSRITGSSSATTFVSNLEFRNDTTGGFLIKTSALSITYSSDSYGRTTFTPSAMSGDVLYLYNSRAAAALFADGSSGSAQSLVGWVEPQTASSWTLSSFNSTLYSLFETANGNYQSGGFNASFTAGSDGSFSNFAQDKGDQDMVSWDESITSGSIALDSTYSSYGAFDVSVTAGGSTDLVYCIAINADSTASSGSTKGKLACIDSSSDSSPKVALVTE